MVAPYKSPVLDYPQRPDAFPVTHRTLVDRFLVPPVVFVALAAGAGVFAGVAMAAAYWTFRLLTH